MQMLMTVMMAIMDQWFLWMWRMPICKTRVPTVVMYYRSFQCYEADNCQYWWTPDEMEAPHTTCCSECSLTGGGGMQKIVGVMGKIFCQMHTFAFIICLALSKQDKMYKKNISIWEIITFRI